MHEIESLSGLRSLKKKLESLRSRVDIPQLGDAIQSMLTAANYGDKPMLESSANALYSCLAELSRDVVRDEVNQSQDLVDTIRKAWRECLDGVPQESFEVVKDMIESLIDERIADLTKMRYQMVKVLAEKGFHIGNAQELVDGIRSLREFRDGILKDWPSANKPPSPLNRKRIAGAREAIARGEKGLRKDELVWGNGTAKE